MGDYAIGVDLGSSKIEAALIDRTGNPLDFTRRETHPEEGIQAVVHRIVACVKDLASQVEGEAIAGVGIGVPGAVNSQQGEGLPVVNLGWQGVPLGRLVAESLGREWEQRLWVDNNTNTAVLGEMMYGAGQDKRHLLYVTIGTGVGSGMILNGRIYHGATGGAGEIGHIVLDPEGEPCSCGRRGCLETLIAGPAIERQARASLKRGMPSSLDRRDPETVTSVEVVSAALTGDWLARSALENAGVYLGIALAYYVSINNPELIIIGGGLGAAAGELLLASARQIIEARSMPGNAETAQLAPPGLGGASGVIGAAALVWHKLDGK